MEFHFYQRNPQNRWVRYYQPVLLEFTSSGMVFREVSTLLLLVDCPIRAIAKLETLQCLNTQQQESFVLVIRLLEHDSESTNRSVQTPPLAIATCFKPHYDRIIQEMRYRRVIIEEAPKLNLFDSASIETSPCGIPLPNLKNPLVQRYILALRFSPRFNQMVSDLDTFFDQLGGSSSLDSSRIAPQMQQAEINEHPSSHKANI